MIGARLLQHELSHAIAALRAGAASVLIEIRTRGHATTHAEWPGGDPSPWQSAVFTAAGLLVEIDDASADRADLARHDPTVQQEASAWVARIVGPDLAAIPQQELNEMLATIRRDGALLIEPPGPSLH